MANVVVNLRPPDSSDCKTKARGKKNRPAPTSAKDHYVAELKQLSKQEQVAELKRVLRELDLGLKDFGVVTITL